MKNVIQNTLDALFPNPEVPLHYSSPFTLLVATLLSAQCTDERVNTITPALFSRADTAEKMAALAEEKIEAIIRPLGLSGRKAKALKSLSSELLERHEGRVPDTFEELEALSGVGHKTASCVMAHAFKQPAFPVDTHIFRLARRWKLSLATTVEGVEKDLKRLFPKTSWNKLHLQMIFFGRLYCPARGHIQEACPICSKIA